mgnify:CR=1 FL=1
MEAKDKDVASLPESINETKQVDQSRRSFAKAGAVLAPVMMTLANRSAWAGGNHCTSFEAFKSYVANPAMSHGFASEITVWKTPSEWAADPGLGSFITSKFGNRDNGQPKLSKLWPSSSYIWTDGGQKVVDALGKTTLDLDAYQAATLLNQLAQSESVLATLILERNLAYYDAFYSSVCLTGIPPI